MHDESTVYNLLVRIFRSPELLVKLTEEPPAQRAVRRRVRDEGDPVFVEN